MAARTRPQAEEEEKEETEIVTVDGQTHLDIRHYE